MAKPRWKILQDSSNVAKVCVKSKYFHKNHVTQFKNGSVTWKNIGKGWTFSKINIAIIYEMTNLLVSSMTNGSWVVLCIVLLLDPDSLGLSRIYIDLPHDIIDQIMSTPFPVLDLAKI